MSLLGKTNININIKGNTPEVISAFLRVYLANQNLTERELEVTVQLVKHYAQYILDGVKEPYASTLLFSTDVRKEMQKALKISGAHLNNTFNALTKKNILAKEDSYIMNPDILPTKSITFNFKIIDDNKG